MSTLDASAIKARNNLLILFAILTILDLVLVVVSRDLWAIGRILITIAVMYFVIQGHKWARWTLIGILSLVVALLLALVFALYSKLSTFLIVGSLILVVVDICAVTILIRDRNLKRYFALKRQVNYREG